MPLLCTSLLALLLLPLSLSCTTKQTPEKVGDIYRATLQTDLNNLRESIVTLLQNSSCPHLDLKIPNCTVNVDFVGTLHILNCRMKTLKVSHVDRLATSVQNSIRCPCEQKENKRRTSMRQKRNKLKRLERETKKLCKANAILSTMTECYAMLNIALMDT